MSCQIRDDIHPCHETTSTLHLYRGHANIASLPLKLRQHFIRRSRDNIHEATSKLHLHRSHVNIHEAMLTLHIAIEAMSTLYSHRNCANVHLCYKAIFRGNIAQASRAYSTVARHQDFRDANKMLKMHGVSIKTLKMQGLLVKISKMPTKP